MTARRTGKVLTRVLLLLLIGLAASVFGTLAAHAYTNNDAAPGAPVVRLLSVAPMGLSEAGQPAAPITTPVQAGVEG
jgi:hypothetical protein